MGKAPRLRALRPLLPPAKARLPAQTGGESTRTKRRYIETPWRRWYATARWEALRQETFARDGYTCQMEGCGLLIASPSARVCDHIEPHKGDEALFWDRGNLQTLCKPCHDGRKQAQERRNVGAASGGSGALARPSWFTRSYVPLTIVCGPPGAGKTSYVAAHAGAGDLVVCFDQIATRMFGREGERRAQGLLTINQVFEVLRERNRIIGGLMMAAARERWPAAWVILTEPEPAHRQWWHDATGAHVVVLQTPAAECMRRIHIDDTAGDRRGASAREAVASWWARYAPARCDRVAV